MAIGTVENIQVGQLVGYLVHPSTEPERIVMRLTELPPLSPGCRAKGLVVACSGSTKEFIGREGHFFIENLECSLTEGDVEAWVNLEIPASAFV